MNFPKIGILSLGCPRNLVDSESILSRLSFKKYPIVDIAKADIAIVNTCAFIDEAKKESIDAILDLIDLKKQGRLKRIIVYGCLVGRYKEALIKELPQIDAFVGTISLKYENRRFSLVPRHYAYLKICEGCIHKCSYCAIPNIKPRFTSLDIDSLLKKVEVFNKNKLSELNIIGQDISGYGIDLYAKKALPKLLKKIVHKAKNIGWLRLLYLYPNGITNELLDLIAGEPKICKYIDLPIQHINNRILKLMNRHTSKKAVLGLLDKIRKKIPDAAIRTSIIVGFPSETDKEFQELLTFLKSARFERLGAFIYSREEGTPACNFKKQISRNIKLARFNALMSQQQAVSCDINRRFQGKVIDVLIDEKEKDSFYLGRSQHDAPEVDGLVYVNSQKKLNPGAFIKARITDTMEYDLVGENIYEYS